MSWDDPRAIQAANRGPREQLFLNLKDDLRVRVIGAPEFFERHWVRSRTGKDVAIRCPGATNCPACAMGDKPRLRAILPVLDRKTNKAKLIDVPQIIVGYLKALNDGEWGDLTQYDVVIQRVQIGRKTDYQVTPQPNKIPLSHEDKEEMKRFFETIDYKKYTQPHTIEEALALLNGQQLPSKRSDISSYTSNISVMGNNPYHGYVPSTSSTNPQMSMQPQNQLGNQPQNVLQTAGNTNYIPPVVSGTQPTSPNFSQPNNSNFGNVKQVGVGGSTGPVNQVSNQPGKSNLNVVNETLTDTTIQRFINPNF